MKILPILCIATASLFICDTAEAQKRRRGGGNVFAKLDTNKDGKISKAEAKGSRLEQRFDKIDKNKDGFITKDELGRGKGKGKRRKGGKRKRK